MMGDSIDLGSGGFALGWLALIVLGGVGYVLYRVFVARGRGEDAGEASRRALGDALPIVGAGIAGFVIFLALMALLLIVLFFAVIASLGGDYSGFGVVVLLLLLALLMLVGLPVAALVFVIRRRRRRDG